MAKKMDISRRFKDGYSASAAARIIGVDIKYITSRIFEGKLKASRRGSRRLSQQGGDWHVIERADLRTFIIENIGSIDIRKVDKLSFVDLLVNEKPNVALEEARRKYTDLQPYLPPASMPDKIAGRLAAKYGCSKPTIWNMRKRLAGDNRPEALLRRKRNDAGKRRRRHRKKG